jgi:hypothetical protein
LNSLLSGKQSSIDGFCSHQSAHIDHQIDQCIEIGNGVAIVNLWTLNAQFFGLAIDALARGALSVHSMVERSVTIEGDTLDAAALPVDILDTALALEELRVLAGLPSRFGKEQGTLETLGAIAVSMEKRCSRMHRQTDRTTRRAVRQTRKRSFAVLVERNSPNAPMTCRSFIDVPGIIGRISCQMSRILLESMNGLAVERAEVRDIAFIERLSVLGQDDIAVVRGGGSSDTRAVAPKQFFLLFS